MNRFDVIESCLTLYEQQAAEQPWRRERDAPAQCRVLEDVVAYGLMIHDRMIAAGDQFARMAPAGKEEFDRTVVDASCRAWTHWLQTARTVVARIEFLERQGCEVEHSERMRECVGYVSTMPLNVDEIEALHHRLQKPSVTVSMKEASDELRRQTLARSAQ